MYVGRVRRFNKALDSINHELLFKLLETFGIPDRVITVIKNLYKKIKIKLTVGKYVNFVDYSILELNKVIIWIQYCSL